MEPVWWETREAKVRRAAGILSAPVDFSVDAALVLLEQRASTTGSDLEDTVAIVTREVRVYPHVSVEAVDYRDALTLPRPHQPSETMRCDWESDMEGHVWPRTVHSSPVAFSRDPRRRCR